MRLGVKNGCKTTSNVSEGNSHFCPRGGHPKKFAVNDRQIIARRKPIGGIQNGCPAPTNDLLSGLKRQRALIVAHTESSNREIRALQPTIIPIQLELSFGLAMSVAAGFRSALQPEAGRQAVFYVISNERLPYEMRAVVEVMSGNPNARNSM